MTWLELLNGLGLFSIGVAAIAWLLKKLLSQMLNKDLETFKSSLEKEVTAYRIRYERLHTERIVVIKEVYKKIVQAHESLRSLINPWQGAGEPTIQEKGAKAADTNMVLMSYYQENRIFFEEEFATDIDGLLSEFREAWNKFHLSQIAREDGERKEGLKGWNDAWDKINKEAPVIKQQLEKRFRSTLGIDNQ